MNENAYIEPLKQKLNKRKALWIQFRTGCKGLWWTFWIV